MLKLPKVAQFDRNGGSLSPEYTITVREKKTLLQYRTAIPGKITLKEMPDAIRYDRLKPESKLFMNVIKMICYRAETAMAETVSPIFINKKKKNGC